jgi:hypothetical protein
MWNNTSSGEKPDYIRPPCPPETGSITDLIAQNPKIYAPAGAYVFGRAGMAVPRKAISQKNSAKNNLRGPYLFLQEHLHDLRGRWFDLRGFNKARRMLEPDIPPGLTGREP